MAGLGAGLAASSLVAAPLLLALFNAPGAGHSEGVIDAGGALWAVHFRRRVTCGANGAS